MAPARAFGYLVLIMSGAAAPLAAQPIFSIDFQGPTIAQVDSFSNVPITEGDLLIVSPSGIPMTGSAGVPRIAAFAGVPNPGGGHLGLSAYATAVGHAPGAAGRVEVDALSFGNDFLLDPNPPFMGVWTFSIDEFAAGVPHGVTHPPNLVTEGAAGAEEACADIMSSFGPGDYPPGPLAYSPVVVPPPSHTVLFDGSGTAPPAVPHPALTSLHGLGLIEPHASAPTLPDSGDNLDALDVDTAGVLGNVPFPIYFSLDSSFADPLETAMPPSTGPVNSGSAAAHGFSGGDVLVALTPGAAPTVYASANALGLDLLAGPDTDDLDALVLWENGVPGYQPSINFIPPYDWGPGGADMLLFSVRRGSAVIGMPDSAFGVTIEEGDILVPPFMGGPALPAIFIAAENLGLATARSAAANPADDLDALDVSPDCNLNGVPDALDIALGLDQDCNASGVPDSCEVLCGDGFCCPEENHCACQADCPPAAGEVPGATCADGLDNDCDGPLDCADADCAFDPACACGNAMCDAGETACTCPADCGPPAAAEVPGMTCGDGLDNDCSGGTDCADSDCAAEPGCGCVTDTDCDDGQICTCDTCSAGTCVFAPTIYGDTNCAGDSVDVDDILCVLDGFVDYNLCPGADLDPPCTGDADIDVDDILAVLSAFEGFDPCGC